MEKVSMKYFDSGKKTSTDQIIYGTVHPLMAEALDEAKKRNKRKWDYKMIAVGVSGSGKSTCVRSLAKYCCPWFDESYTTFTADEFIKKTTECPNLSAVILDEAFADLNSSVARSTDFLRLLHRLQIVRQ